MPPEQGLESRFVPAGQERPQQVGVGRTIGAGEEGGSAEVPEDGVHSCAPGLAVPAYLCISPGEAGALAIFGPRP